jgi:hypothetical protein
LPDMKAEDWDTIHSRIKTMTNTNIEKHEESLLTYEVSDEALEIAVGSIVAGNYTLAACTGLSVCPG